MNVISKFKNGNSNCAVHLLEVFPKNQCEQAMADGKWDPENIFDVFGDPLSRKILVLASQKPLSAGKLAKYTDVSPATVYRRMDTLVNYDLVKVQTRPDEDGNHYKIYETTLKQITFEIESDGYNIDVKLRQSLVGQFEAFWDDLNDSTPEVGFDSSSDSDREPHSGGHDG